MELFSYNLQYFWRLFDKKIILIKNNETISFIIYNIFEEYLIRELY